MAREIGIEDLVRWAWTEELPKCPPDRGSVVAPRLLGFGDGWGAMTGDGDRWDALLNDFGAIYNPMADPVVDDDALSVADAVMGLDAMVVRELPDADFFGDMGDLGSLGDAALARAWAMVIHPAPSDDGLSTLRGLASTTVVRVATTGRWPAWIGPVPTIVDDMWPNGRPKWLRKVSRVVEWDGEQNPLRSEDVEADGFDRQRQRPYPGAWRAQRLEPDPAPMLAERIRWSMLHEWLSHLAACLDGLGDRKVSPPKCSPSPWLGA